MKLDRSPGREENTFRVREISIQLHNYLSCFCLLVISPPAPSDPLYKIGCEEQKIGTFWQVDSQLSGEEKKIVAFHYSNDYFIFLSYKCVASIFFLSFLYFFYTLSLYDVTQARTLRQSFCLIIQLSLSVCFLLLQVHMSNG